jgi:hypothetical protein
MYGVHCAILLQISPIHPLFRDHHLRAEGSVVFSEKCHCMWLFRRLVCNSCTHEWMNWMLSYIILLVCDWMGGWINILFFCSVSAWKNDWCVDEWENGWWMGVCVWIVSWMNWLTCFNVRLGELVGMWLNEKLDGLIGLTQCEGGWIGLDVVEWEVGWFDWRISVWGWVNWLGYGWRRSWIVWLVWLNVRLG